MLRKIGKENPFPTFRESKDKIARMIQEDDFVAIRPAEVVRGNGTVNVGRQYAGHRSVVIVARETDAVPPGTRAGDPRRRGAVKLTG